MQNSTGRRSVLIWGFPARLPRLEMLVTCSFRMWATSVLGPCPVGPIWFYRGWRSQLLIRFTFEPLPFEALALLPPIWFYCGSMEMALDENLHEFEDSPHICLVWRSQLLIRFEFEPPRFQALALLPRIRFYCGTMQNGTGWKSALIWGFPA